MLSLDLLVFFEESQFVSVLDGLVLLLHTGGLSVTGLISTSHFLGSFLFILALVFDGTLFHLFLLGQFDFRSCGVNGTNGVGSSDRD